MKRKRITIEDIALRCGVSRATVSVALSSRADARISEETRLAVRRAADELGYQFSGGGRGGKGGRRTILFLHKELAGLHVGTSFFVRVAEELRAVGLNRDLVVIEASAPSSGDTVALRRLIADFRPAAVVVHDDDSCDAVRAIDAALPILFLQGGSRPGSTWNACYIVDDRRVGELAAEALLAAGRRRAAIFFPLPGSSRCATERMDGFRSVWEPSGGSSELIQLSSLAPVYVEAVAAGLGDVWQGSERLDAARLVEARFTGTRFDSAYFFSDAAALAGMRALLTVGVRVPADVAVIGTDNLFWGAFSVPSLTTMELNERLFARRIADDLEASFRGAPWSGAVVRLPVSLIKRESA